MTDHDLLAQAATKAREITAELKNIARDVTGLMYEWTEDHKLRLRDYVATADTNTRPPKNCDDLVWAVRGQSIELQELLEQLQGVRLAMVCPCCAAVDLMDNVLDGTAGWKLVSDTHSENLVGDLIVPVQEWQCGDCAPYAHSEVTKEVTPDE
jgi:hypothetical protein